MWSIDPHEEIPLDGWIKANACSNLACAASDSNTIDDRITGQRWFWHPWLLTDRGTFWPRLLAARLYARRTSSENLNLFTGQQHNPSIGSVSMNRKVGGKIPETLLSREIKCVY